MKSLRGAKSLDIIFAGTQNRKSLGFAEASLVFDNEDGALPIEYTEVTITRKLYRSGETGYYINKVPCRLKDVLELFMDTGIGKDGYSIIGQGKIDEILSNKSEDRRHIFEEAAGIVKYRARKQESEKKLEHTKLNLLRINDILSEIETNLDPLKVQSEKAKQYLNLREELKSIEIGLFIYNIEKYKTNLEDIVKDEEIYTTQCNEEEGRLERIKNLKEELKTQIDEITEKIEEMSNIGFESQKEIEMLNSDINVANTRIANNKENSERFANEIEELKARITELDEEEILGLTDKLSNYGLQDMTLKINQTEVSQGITADEIASVVEEKLSVTDDTSIISKNSKEIEDLKSEILTLKAKLLDIKGTAKYDSSTIKTELKQKYSKIVDCTITTNQTLNEAQTTKEEKTIVTLTLNQELTDDENNQIGDYLKEKIGDNITVNKKVQ